MLTNSNQSPKTPQLKEPDLSELEIILQESKGIKKQLGKVSEDVYLFYANESNRQTILETVLKMQQKTEGELANKEKAASTVDEIQILSRMVLAEKNQLRKKSLSFGKK
jgi:hypothetical protein